LCFWSPQRFRLRNARAKNLSEDQRKESARRAAQGEMGESEEEKSIELKTSIASPEIPGQRITQDDAVLTRLLAGRSEHSGLLRAWTLAGICGRLHVTGKESENASTHPFQVVSG
jgi:hypothetical protein